MENKNEILQKILNKIAEVNKQRETALVEIRKDFPPLLKSVFEKYPTITSMSIPFYTDYWNDGEECLYKVRYYSMRINGINEDDYFNDEIDETTWNFYEEVMKEFESILKEIPIDFYENLFGDHIEVTFYSNGDVKTEVYKHD